MTAPTISRPARSDGDAPAASNSAGAAPGAAQRGATVVGLDVAAALGLATYSLVAALGYARVFSDWDFVGSATAVVLVGHGLSLALRRLRIPGVIAMLVTMAALVWTVAYLHYPTTFTAGFPTTGTWDIARADLLLVRDQFPDAVAPVAYVGGWALLASIGVAFVVFTSDTFAFRAHARGESLVPGAVLFVFVAALGVDRHRVALTLALIASGFLAAVLLRARFAQVPRTTLGRPRHPLSIALPAALVAGALVVLGAWVLGPRLPGASAEPLLETRREGGGVTEVPSQLVDIRNRLVNNSATELFVVESTTPSYWRATALPEFDGNTWELPDRDLEDVSGTLSDALPGSTENRQEITVIGLRGGLVPAAAEPVAASGEDLRWNAETSTLVKVGEPLVAGDAFVVVSAMPVLRPEELRTATMVSPPDPIYLALPNGFPATVRDTAAVVTAGAPSAYDAMLTLQNWFRSNFEYSLEIPQGHGNSAIEAFLRQRIGYCEQFAGTFAAMARSLGIPARVAVGYTPGVDQGAGVRSVLGKNAHAWPEVWFDQFGWVAFEPTPGRGAPGAEGYTGVAAAQDDTIPQPGTGGDAPAVEAVPATAPPATIPASELVPDAAAAAQEDAFEPVKARLAGPQPPWAAIAIVILLLAAAALAPEAVRRWRRRHPREDVATQLVDLWDRAIAAVEATGFRADPSLTPLEQARAAAPRLPVAARPLKSLAAVATAAAYAPRAQLDELIEPFMSNDVAGHHGRRDDGGQVGPVGPRRWCRQVERIASDSMTAAGRARRYFTVWR